MKERTKLAAILAALFLAMGIAGESDYQMQKQLSDQGFSNGLP